MSSAEGAAEELPEWKKAFLPKPSISIRRGYASGYDPPFENTSTLVLTARSGRFVDIRFPTELLDAAGGSRSLLTTHPAFWAFTGISKTTFITNQSTKQTSTQALEFACSGHTVWTHDIDSRGSGIEDQADMFLLPNGDTMEVGFGTDSTTGKFEMYKEYWTEPDLGEKSQTFIADSQSISEISKSPCIVAECRDNTENSAKGMAIRIGGFCQGIFEDVRTHSESNFVVERWTRAYSSQSREKIGSWARDPRSNNIADEVPCDWIINMEELPEIGDSVTTSQGNRWEIVEVE